MNDDDSDQVLERLQQTVGAETLLSVLPQSLVKRSLQLRSVTDLADELAVPYETLRSRIETGLVPEPEMRLGRRAFFTAEQVRTIKRNSSR
ncbi:helix-turn-helix domain-containing protein [Stieleria sp. JC731]|uniref:helix-turn-helix domain-containing protein n=1 Tax=Pirellulaceae TaxID=2691357 RepID=UPI001E55786D|nr:helix-turn-helix domain-containing protein [Stieleria sp. JC731]MCC9602894.1 helix-turn-helix domain-containing protein [Stieleria sp. JC731]